MSRWKMTRCMGAGQGLQPKLPLAARRGDGAARKGAQSSRSARTQPVNGQSWSFALLKRSRRTRQISVQTMRSGTGIGEVKRDELREARIIAPGQANRWERLSISCKQVSVLEEP